MRDPGLIALLLAQPAFRLLKAIVLDLPHPAQSPFEDELHDLMQLSPIEECAVAAAHIDNRAGQTPEIHPVHELPASRARSVLDTFCRRRPRRWDGTLLQNRRLPLAVRTQAFEGRRLDPCSVAVAAFEQVNVADANPTHLAATSRALDGLLLELFGPAPRRSAERTERSALEEQAEADGAPNGRQPRLAIVTSCRFGRCRGPAAWTTEGRGFFSHPWNLSD